MGVISYFFLYKQLIHYLSINEKDHVSLYVSNAPCGM